MGENKECLRSHVCHPRLRLGLLLFPRGVIYYFYASTKVSEKIHDMRCMNNIKFSNSFEGEKYNY